MFARGKTALLIILVLIAVSCKNSVNINKDTEVSPPNELKKKSAGSYPVYGIPADSFDVIPGRIKPNTFLSEILVNHGVSMQEIDQVIKGSISVFDVRNVRSGNKYLLYCDRDSSAKARYLVYEHNATTSFVFSFNDSINITPYTREVRRVVRFASGTIETSLWTL